MNVVSQYLCKIELKVSDSHYIEPNSQFFLLLNQQPTSLHHQQPQVRQHNEKRTILSHDTDSSDKSARP
jgi:hypothetical protein